MEAASSWRDSWEKYFLGWSGLGAMWLMGMYWIFFQSSFTVSIGLVLPSAASGPAGRAAPKGETFHTMWKTLPLASGGAEPTRSGISIADRRGENRGRGAAAGNICRCILSRKSGSVSNIPAERRSIQIIVPAAMPGVGGSPPQGLLLPPGKGRYPLAAGERLRPPFSFLIFGKAAGEAECCAL